MLKIIPVETDDQVQQVIALAQEYVTWMIAAIRENYPDLDLEHFAVSHQYDDVRKKYPGEHIPPHGRLYLALSGDQVGGCIALGRLSDTICEMRTLFVRTEFRGLGIGKILAETVIRDAREIGYHYMRLDSLGFMDGAQHLYRSLGFYEIAPYTDVSEAMAKFFRFFELAL